MTNSVIPEWLEASVQRWHRRLGLAGWRVNLVIAPCAGKDPKTAAMTEQYPDINQARITFRADITDTLYGEEVVAHELLHVAHGRIDSFLEGAVFPRLTKEARRIAQETYRQLIESYTEQLAVDLAYALYTPHASPDDEAVQERVGEP